jgi:hypothetical protein
MSESSAGETVVLIHGLWMTPRSWEKEVEAIREDPSPLLGLGVGEIADHALEWATAHHATPKAMA